MDRRAFLATAAAGVALGPTVASAQRAGAAFRVGFLALRSGPGPQDEAFREALRGLGYVEGRNLTIEYRWAASHEERLPTMAKELVDLKVNVIVASSTPAIEAAKAATSTIPIVMAAVADPVGSHLVAGVAHPGGNVTGLTLLSSELAGKRLQLARELVPKASRVAVLVNRASSATPLFVEQMRSAGQQMGIQLVIQEMSSADAFAGAFAAMQRERAQAVVVQISALTNENVRRIAELAAQYRLPAMYEVRAAVDAGGLLSYGPNIPEMFRRAAFFVHRILKGAKPSDLPIEEPSKFELVINMKAAKALGLTIPQSLLVRADQVIE